MKFFKTIYFYIKIAFLYHTGKRISKEDYKKDYDKISKYYDNLWTRNMKKYTLRLVNKLNIKKDSKVLDLACGTGFVTFEIAKQLKNSGKIYAVDISKKMLAVAKNKNKYKNIRFIQGNMLEEIQKFPKNYFDFIVCAWALAYTNPKKLLREIFRVLKKKAYVAIIVNRKGTLNNINFAFLNLMRSYPQNIRKVMDIQFRLPKDKDYLKKLFFLVGLTPTKVWQDQKLYNFKKGIQAYNWVKNSSAIAGTGQIMNKNFDKEIAKILDTYYSTRKGITIIHKFVAGIARK